MSKVLSMFRRQPAQVRRVRRGAFLLPSMFTVANMFCGWACIVYAMRGDFVTAAPFIGFAMVLDLLDGRIARATGATSDFGVEFDSLADIVSFGLVPAFLVHRIVLRDVFHEDMQELGWFIASIYVICGALRLARFNCLSAMEEERQKERKTDQTSEFVGFPIPAAAGLVASITYFLIWLEERDFSKGNWKFALPVLLVFLSIMMVSKVKYPTFKKVNLRGARSFFFFVVAAIGIGLLLNVHFRHRTPML